MELKSKIIDIVNKKNSMSEDNQELERIEDDDIVVKDKMNEKVIYIQLPEKLDINDSEFNNLNLIIKKSRFCETKNIKYFSGKNTKVLKIEGLPK
jgi:methyl coenzyme M reductase beta subunit